MNEPKRMKVTVNLSTEVMDALRYIASQRGISLTEALRQAITTEQMLAKEVENGQQLILRDPKNKHERRLIFKSAREKK